MPKTFYQIIKNKKEQKVELKKLKICNVKHEKYTIKNKNCKTTWNNILFWV